MCVCVCACVCCSICLTLCDSMDCSPPGSSAYGIFQSRTLECVAISFSRGSSRPRDRKRVSGTAGRFFTARAMRKALYIYLSTLFHTLFHCGLSQDIEYSSLCYAVGPCCLFNLCIIFASVIPNSQSTPLPPSPSHLATARLFSVSMSMFLLYK